MRLGWRAGIGCVCVIGIAANAAAQTAAQTSLTWQEVRDKFLATNPTLQAGQVGIDESKATEITAYLRPNPGVAVTLDQIGNTVGANVGAFSAATLSATAGYLHERGHKRELRRDSAQGATTIAVSGLADLVRNTMFTLRSAFVQVLQAKAFRTLARENLTNYDQVLTLGRDRLQAGDIAQIDLDRLQLQRVQFETDVQTAEVNLRTAKIQLLRLLNDQTTRVEQFDVTGPYDFAPPPQGLDELHRVALDTRPDLKAAIQSIDKARTDHRLAEANGTTDPTFTVDFGFPSISDVYQSYQPPLRQYAGISVSIPLRFFDRNQGEKLRTQLDITRNERLAEAARMQVFSDVDVAYATMMSNITLLQPYKTTYLAQATRVRDTVTFSYQRGGASLLDFLQAEQEYRSVQIGYVNLVAAYLTAVAQLNLAVGQEVIP